MKQNIKNILWALVIIYFVWGFLVYYAMTAVYEDDFSVWHAAKYTVAWPYYMIDNMLAW